MKTCTYMFSVIYKVFLVNWKYIYTHTYISTGEKTI